MKTLLLCIVVALALTSCSEPNDGVPRSAPTSSSPSPEERAVTVPKGVVVQNAAFGRSKRLARQAIADLKRMGFWHPLTKRLYIVRIQSRLGRIAIPDDGHLADVLLQAQVDKHRSGALCNIMFFPTAIEDDLGRWRDYWNAGYMEEEPPTVRQFWAAILGHELAHCQRREDKRGIPIMAGEPVAEKWEAKVLAKARKVL